MKKSIIKILSSALVVILTFSCFWAGFIVFSQNSYTVGDTITFGSYPQTKVTDETTLEALNLLLSEGDFTDMNYYIGDGTVGSEQIESYYFYCDKTYDGIKYRAIYFNKYRPSNTYSACPSEEVNQYTKRGYYKDNVYWFRFEPIEWIVLEPSSGLIFTKNILDSQAYNNTHESVSDFSESSIKQYLNDNWINTALSGNELSAITTSGDKITLLTESQAENENYGFTSDDSRKGTVTDYSIVNGNVASNIGSDIVANWILKDKYDESNINSVSFFGKFSFCDMNSVRGIRPVTNIDLTKANRFSITYRLNGEIIKTEEYEQGEAVIPYTPEIEGYTFNGWDTVIPQTMPAHSIEANANVTVNSYSLTLDANGGIFADNSSIKESMVEYNSPLIPEEPTREGYTFDYWENFHDKMPADDLTMTAIWNESEDTPYKINTYKENLNGEYDCETEIRQGRTNETINLEPEEPEGYVLDTEKSELTGSISPDGKSEFSVYYNLKEYELTFDFSGESETITHTYKHGQQIDPPVIPRRTGFAGKWDKDIPDVCTSSETYSVIWLEDSFSITFNTAGGSNINNAVYKFGAPIIKPDDPVKEGWTFVGWDKEFPTTMPAEDLEFTALWQVNTYSVRWNANGDTKEETYTYGEKIREPIIIENDGFAFAGWDKTVPSAMPAANLEFNAVFTEKRFTLTWIVDGSTLKRETYKYGETIIEPSVPERAGFTFSWNNHTDSMPAKDITISGTYTKASTDGVTPEIRIVNYKNVITVDYKTTITFRAQVKNSSGKPVQWYVNNEFKGNGDTFTVNLATETFNIKCITADSDGAKVSSETELVKVKTDFWSIIVAFFRMLFRRLPVITQ